MKQHMGRLRNFHDGLDQKKFSVLEVTQEYLKLSASSDLNAYIQFSQDRALQQARDADALIAKEGGKVPREKYPVLGAGLAIKDLFTIQGVQTTCASNILRGYAPPYTATLIERLEAAGAVSLGKTNMDEFAMGSSNENSAFGAVKHPTHPDRVPGGSSGGSAAAVKAGLCLAALGTDTGGSIRLPASYCGVVGMKPTYGTISRYGMIAFASSLDQAGPLASSVEDCATLLEVMAGRDPRDSTSMEHPEKGFRAALKKEPEWSKLRIGVPDEYFGTSGIAPAVEAKLREALKWFESKGAKLVPVKLPHTKYAIAVYYLVAVAEASSNLSRFDGVRFGSRPAAAESAGSLAEFYEIVRAQFGPEVKRRIILGAFALSSGYYDAYYGRACQVRRLIQQDFTKAFESVDFIAGPVSTQPAFKIGEKVNDPLQMYLNDIFTVPVSLAGLPALSVPCGEDPDRLPIGLQLIGPAFSDGRLMSLANAYEKARDA